MVDAALDLLRTENRAATACLALFSLSIKETTNTKAMLVAKNGQPVFRTSVPVSLLHAEAGFVEQESA